MVQEHARREQRIVTCDGCGNPYAAVVERGDVVLVGTESGRCPNCDGTAFTRLSL